MNQCLMMFFLRVKGKRFGIPFDIGDTVGCGVRRHLQTQESFVYFTNNGDLIPSK